MTGEIGKALANAYADIQHAVKNASNPHFKSTYANLEEVINVIRAAYSRHGLAIMQMPGELIRDGDLVKVRITTTVIHSSGEMLSGQMEMPVVADKNGKITAHAVGSAISFGRRYSLAATAGITQSDDDGNAASDGDESEPEFDLDSLRTQVQGAKTLEALTALGPLVTEAGDESVIALYKARRKALK